MVPDGFACDEITRQPVQWSTGQPPAEADAVVWAIGRVRPNTGWLPDSLLDEHGFVDVGPTLQTRARPEVFAIGDVAATDPLRSSARNRADGLLAENIRAYLAGRPLKRLPGLPLPLGIGARRAGRRSAVLRRGRSRRSRSRRGSYTGSCCHGSSDAGSTAASGEPENQWFRRVRLCVTRIVMDVSSGSHP